jgi:hypothetical protein
VHPEAAHPLLLRLGATEATARTALEAPEVRTAITAAWDDGSGPEVGDAVLALVAAAHLQPGELDWLGDLLLTDDEEEQAAARDLVLPGSLVDLVADPELVGRPDMDLLERWGRDVLAAVGVLDRFGVLLDHDVVLDPVVDDDPHGLDDEVGWLRTAIVGAAGDGAPVVAVEMMAVRDLDLVRDDAWDETLAALAADRDTREAVLRPLTLVRPDGRRVAASSYTAWWLGRHARLGGRAPSALALPGDLAGLYDEASSDLDDGFLAAVGVRTSVAALLATRGGADELLQRLADDERPVSAEALRRVYMGLASLEPQEVSPPDDLRVRPELVVPADDALVLDSPAHLQLRWPTPPIVVPLGLAADLAAVLDVDTTSQRVPEPALPEGEAQDTPAVARLLVPEVPATWVEHAELTVAGQSVTWWVPADGTVHACTLDGLARGLAWVSGRWSDRWPLAAVLADPFRLDELRAEAGVEGDG